ncbi:glycosyltransferase family 4 protein [Clostridioides sp. ZZV14-6045]|uniref:glycosyltransferase family 4 protein n=1 Tax=Clostridioides sp. ZZV14-6045 TaxID=2811489 RepID=UPI001D123883|nr:glycosyltransferase family 4 protein [Clostridioides sp. ZZV14-6045]
MKVKIALISEALGGGVRRHIIDLMENLDKDKFDIYFLYNYHRADDIMQEKISNLINLGVHLVEIKNLSNKIGLNDIFALKNIYRELKKINPDIVHCHSSKAGAVGRIAAKFVGVKFIYYTPHAYIFQNIKLSRMKKEIYIFIEKILSRYFTTKTINVSVGEKNYALNCNIDKNDKFIVIYNGVKENYSISNILIKNKLKKEFDVDKESMVVGVVSRVDEQKDPNTFINIAKYTLNKYSNVKFIYVGDGDLYKSMKECVLHERLEEKILFTGFRKDTEDILSIFDIVLTTSLYEGMPYVLVESLASSLPIIATDVIGNNEIVVNNKNGLLFEVGNHIQGFDCLEKLLENKNMIKSMRLKSLEIYEEKFTLDIMMNEYEKLYNIN